MFKKNTDYIITFMNIHDFPLYQTFSLFKPYHYKNASITVRKNKYPPRLSVARQAALEFWVNMQDTSNSAT